MVTSGVFGEAAVEFARDLGRRLPPQPLESPTVASFSCRESLLQ